MRNEEQALPTQEGEERSRSTIRERRCLNSINPARIRIDTGHPIHPSYLAKLRSQPASEPLPCQMEA